MSPEALIGQTLGGLASASSLFLVAAGLSIIFGVTRVVNFAHGTLFLLGAYIAWTLAVPLGLGFWPALLLAPVAVAGIGLVLELALLRRIYQAPELFQLLATFAVVLIADDLVPLLWGPEDLLGPRAPGLAGAVRIGGLRIPQYDLFLIALGPVVLGLVWLVFTRTRWGLLARAATEDRVMVAALGTDQRWIFTGAFTLGAFLAGLGGALLLPRETIHHDLDTQMIVSAFVVVVVGGMGSLPGAYLAALLLGLASAFGTALVPQGTLVTMGLVMMLVLALRPQGILGRRLRADTLPPAGPGAVLRPATPTQRLGWGALIAVLALSPLWLGSYGLSVVSETVILALSASALHLLSGAGRPDQLWSRRLRWVVGAYGAALAVVKGGAGLGLALAAGIGAGALGGLGVGWFVTRLGGVYLAMLTLAFAEIIHGVTLQAGALTGGDNGLVGVWPPAWIAAPGPFLWLVLALVVPALIGLRAFILGEGGRRLQSARDAPARAAACGLGLSRVQALAFVVAGAAAGLAGGLLAFHKGSVFPTLTAVPVSVDALVMVLLGGIHALSGPLLGAAAYSALKTGLAAGTDFWRLAVGGVLVVLVLAFPGGLASILRRPRAASAPSPTPTPTPSPLPVSPPRPAASSQGEPVLVVSDLARSFGGVAAVDGVSLTVRAGERLAVIGPNGAGKSTLFALIAGQERPDQGRVTLLGRDITGVPASRLARVGLGRTFQSPRPFLTLTVAEALRTAARLSLPRREADARAAFLLERLGLGALASHPGGGLAQGEVRRVDLGLALAGRPRLLLMDEPVAGMALGERAALMDLVGALAHEEGFAVLFTEHDMAVVFGFADRVVVLDRGRALAEGSPEAVRENPAVRACYLGA
ncbi:ABC transporter permease subunit [Pararhodospirillum photometricum]